MRALASLGTGIHFHRVAGHHTQLTRKGLLQFGQRRQAAVVAFDRDELCACAQDGAGQAAGAGADLEGGLAIQGAGNGGDPVEQLFVEQEILAQRLAGSEAMARDHVAQGRQCRASVTHKRCGRGQRLRPCGWRRS